jgi:sugar phosphate permease
MVWTAELMGGEKTGISLGLIFGTSQVAGSISPLFLGYLIDMWGFIQSFYVLIVFSTIAILVTLMIPETN